MSSKHYYDRNHGIDNALGAAIYNSNQKMNEKFDYYWTEAEARFDEQDLTLRAHIGLLEGSLERIEARQRGDKDAESKDGSGIGQNPDYKTSQDKKK